MKGLSDGSLLWCAKNAIYIQLWPLGGFKVEKYVKGAELKLKIIPFITIEH